MKLMAKTAVALFVIALLSITIKGGQVYSKDSAAPEAKYDANTGLVIAPGYETVVAHCTACHSAKIVIQQGLSRSGWLELIEWMQEEQGLWNIPQEQLDTIANYLSTNYGKDRPHFKSKTDMP